MNTPDNPWDRLVAAARGAPAGKESEQAPYGFATRVASRAFEHDRRAQESAAWIATSWRALGVAALIMVGVVAINARPVLVQLEDDAAALAEPSADVLENSA